MKSLKILGLVASWIFSAILLLLFVIFMSAKEWGIASAFLGFGIILIPPVLKAIPIYKEKNLAVKAASLVTMGFVFLMIGVMYFAIFGSIKPIAKSNYIAAPIIQTPVVSKINISDARIIAKIICEDRVKETLKAPRTADFPWTADVSMNGNVATLISYVDAENSFGAMIRTHYVCSLRYNGGKTDDAKSWIIQEFLTLD